MRLRGGDIGYAAPVAFKGLSADERERDRLWPSYPARAEGEQGPKGERQGRGQVSRGHRPLLVTGSAATMLRRTIASPAYTAAQARQSALVPVLPRRQHSSWLG